MGVDRYWEAQDELQQCPAKLAAANARIVELERERDETLELAARVNRERNVALELATRVKRERDVLQSEKERVASIVRALHASSERAPDDRFVPMRLVYQSSLDNLLRTVLGTIDP